MNGGYRMAVFVGVALVMSIAMEEGWAAPGYPEGRGAPRTARAASLETAPSATAALAWRTDLAAALREADDRARPLLVAIASADPRTPPAELRALIAPSAPLLADAAVVADVERRFVPVVVNAMAGLPAELADLASVSAGDGPDAAPHLVTTAVLYPDGGMLLGTSGCLHRCAFSMHVLEVRARCQAYLDESAARFDRLHALLANDETETSARTAELERLRQEVDLAVQMATPCAFGDDDAPAAAAAPEAGGYRERSAR